MITVVGQGLAGSLLAYFLIKEGQEVTVIDSGAPGASSVSAGIIDPITGKRFNKTWNFDLFFPFAKTTYQDFFYPVRHQRIWAEEESYQRWSEKTQTGYLDTHIVPDSIISPGIHNGISYPFGGVEICDSGCVKVGPFLAFLHNFIQSNAIYLKKKIDYTNINTEKIIFCEGFGVAENPYFNTLPFRHSKGEILTIQCDHLSQDFIYNAGYWIVPVGGNQFRVGATYSWDSLDGIPTEKGRHTLTQFLQTILTHPYKIIGHHAGVRPALMDMLPVMGWHPQFPNIGIFNGLGSKGALQAPLLAKQFTTHIVYQEPIDSVVNITRLKIFPTTK